MPIDLQNIGKSADVAICDTQLEEVARLDVDIVIFDKVRKLAICFKDFPTTDAIFDLITFGNSPGYSVLSKGKDAHFFSQYQQEFVVYIPLIANIQDAAKEVQRCLEEEHGLTVKRKSLIIKD